MKILIAENFAPADRVTYRDLNYGRPIEGWQVLPFSIHLSVDELKRAIDREYAQFSEESKADFDEFGEDELPDPLREAGYPALESALEHNSGMLEELLQGSLFLELLDGLFGKNEPSRCKYLINFLTKVSIEGDHVVLTGDVYAVQKRS